MSITHVNRPLHVFVQLHFVELSHFSQCLFNPDKMEDIERGSSKLRLINQTPQDREKNVSPTETKERIFIFILIEPWNETPQIQWDKGKHKSTLTNAYPSHAV